MTSPTDDAAAKYGSIGAMVQRVPELKGIFDQAVAEGWTSDKFVMTVQATNWWRTQSDTARARISLEATDPQSAHQQFADQVDVVRRMAIQAGYQYDEATVNDIAMQSLYTGASPEKIRTEIIARLRVEGTAAGDYATTQNQLRGMAAAYGQTYGAAVTDPWVAGILSGSQTIEQFQEQMKLNAISTYPGSKNLLESGMTMQQIAAPYISRYAELLEINPEGVDLAKTTLLQHALQGAGSQVDGNGVPVQTPLWQFEKQVKQDPRWGFTNNARQEVDSVVNRIGRDMGFLA